MRRRNTLIGLGTIVFGASGFIASGAFEFGSEGSRGDFVRVSPNEMNVNEEGAVDVDDGNGNSAGGDDDANETDDSDDGQEEQGEGEEAEYVTLRTNIAGNGSGSVSVSPVPVASTDGGDREYEAGQTVTLSASPDDGSEFVEWRGGASGDDPETTVEMDGNKTVTAVFERSTFELGVTIGGDGSGTVTISAEDDEPSGSIETDESWRETYTAGAELTLSVEPDEESTFDEWSGDVSREDEQRRISLTMDQNRNVVALLGAPPTLVVNTNGEGEVEIAVGDGGESRTVGPNSTQSVVTDQDALVSLSAITTEDGHRFVGWSGGGSGDDSSITVTMDGNKNVTANFEPQEFDLEISIDGSGSVSISPPGDTVDSADTLTYEFDESVDLTAEPDENYRFVEWEGDLSGDDASGTVRMDQDRSITAVFVESGDTRVQVVSDPDNSGNAINVAGGVEWSGQMTRSDIIETDPDGFFAGFSVENTNRNAVSRIGTVGSNGYPASSDRIAFLVVNIGDTENQGQGGPPVDVGVRLFDADGNNVQTDQLRLPYRVLNENGQGNETGTNLVGETVQLSVGSIIEVVIEIDSTDGTEDIERVGSLQFSAQGVNN